MANLLLRDATATTPRAVGGLALTASVVKAPRNGRRVFRGRARLASVQFDQGDVIAGLSEQQWAVARLVAQGLTNPEIAERLNLSPHTVRNYLASVMGRLGVHNRTAVAVILTKLQSQYLGSVGAEQGLSLARKPRSNRLFPTRPSPRRLA